jgi:high affinity Mn2+ porin
MLMVLAVAPMAWAAAPALRPEKGRRANGHRRHARSKAARRPLRDRIWYAAQWNVITQHNPAFSAAYSGPNSFKNIAETATSTVETVFAGIRLTRRLEFLYDEESSAGSGLSGTVGLAGFPNLDAVRAGAALSPAPYPARGMLHWNIGLGGGRIANTPNYLELAHHLDRRRLELYFGKMSLADFFDRNAYADSDHSQFMNWTADNDGAWDYAANTRGYTYAAYAEFDDGPWTLRFAEALMAKLPNQEFLSLDLGVFRAENAEVDWAYAPASNGKMRLLFFDDHARMGSFANALAAWRAGRTPVPNVNAVAIPASEYGFAWNWQQAVGPDLGLFARAGWNNGAQESYSYTEVNNTVEAGAQVAGRLWRRRRDHAGFAFISNGISSAHQAYLAAGGLGFQLGDGGLSYGRERIEELYYNLHVWRGISLAPDVQFFTNPGYNRARGPLQVYGLRFHLHL